MSKKANIEVRKCELQGCLLCNNREERERYCEEGICKIPSALDNLPIRCVGNWANDKIYYLAQYFGIFAVGMHNKWKNLRYIELCSGPGRCSTRDGHEQDGTALAILNHSNFHYIQKAIFIDYNQEAIETLNKRISALGKNDTAEAILGNYYDESSIASAIGSNSSDCLSLCLVDPTDCSLPFSTVEAIHRLTNRKCDFIISFFDKTDFNRNNVLAIDHQDSKIRKKYERFLGDDSFFKRSDIVEWAKLQQNDKITEAFREAYQQHLSKIGLKYTDMVPVGRFYHLLFASGSKVGLDFWKKANGACMPNGQGLFAF